MSLVQISEHALQEQLLKDRGMPLYGLCLRAKRSRRVSLSPLAVLDQTYMMSTNSLSLLILCSVTLSQGKFKNLLNFVISVVLGITIVSNPNYFVHIWNAPQIISYNKFLFIHVILQEIKYYPEMFKISWKHYEKRRNFKIRGGHLHGKFGACLNKWNIFLKCWP